MIAVIINSLTPHMRGALQYLDTGRRILMPTSSALGSQLLRMLSSVISRLRTTGDRPEDETSSFKCFTIKNKI